MGDPTHDLDGGDGAGQFLRTALTLAALEGESLRVENVRGARPDPGLRSQHLATLEALAEISDAEVSGAELGAETIAFGPEEVEGGAYAVDIDTAGSITLLFGAVLPLATALESPLTLTATGGTDVAWSPPMDYLRHVKLPLLREFGLQASVDVDRRGFYPAGGGQATLRLGPSTLEAIELRERTPVDGVRVYSTQAQVLADADVAHRQAEGTLEALESTEHSGELEVLERVETTAQSAGAGSAIVLRLEGQHTLAGFSALGEPGTPAERVGEEAATAARRFLTHDAPVDRYLADQLLVFLALAGGNVRIPAVTPHVEASLALLESMGYELTLELEGAVETGSGGDGEDHEESGGVVSRTPRR